MINERSLATVAAARLPGGRVRPLYDSYGFARIPGTLLQLFGGSAAESLPPDVLPELDGTPPRWSPCSSTRSAGRSSSASRSARRCSHGCARRRGLPADDAVPFDHDRARDHAHTVQPVGEHRATEWFMYEPSLERVVCPLTAAFAGEERGSLVAAGADLGAIYPQADGLAARLGRLGVDCHLLQPAETIDTPFTRLVSGAARVQGFDGARAGAALAARLARATAPSLTLLYLDGFDSLGHELGPDNPRTEAVALELLEALEQELVDALAGTPGALVLLFADHGQLPTDPRALRVRQRALPAARAAPAPTARTAARWRRRARARDLFLHVREGALDEALGLLAGALRRRRLGGADGASSRPTASSGPDLGALPGAGRRHRRAAARGRGGLVARAGSLRAEPARPPRRAGAGGGRDLARCARPVTAPALRGGIRPLLFPRSVAVVGASDRTRRGRADLERSCAAASRPGSCNPNRRDGARAASAFPR